MKTKVQYFLLGIVSTILLTTGVTAYAASGISKKIDAYYNNIKIVVDGSSISLGKDLAGNKIEPFAYNGTTYLPVRAVSEALGKKVDWDGATNTVYIGEKPGEVTYLMEYGYAGDSTQYTGNTPDSFNIAGMKYTKGYKFKYSQYHLFNLNGQFSELTFDYGGVDVDRLDKDSSLDIYLDGKLYDTLIIPAGQVAKEYTLSVKGVNQLKLHSNNSGWNVVGIGNPIIK